MNIKEVTNLFDVQLKEFSKMKNDFCNNPGKNFTRKRKQDFETIIRSILSLNASSLNNEILRIHHYSADAPTASAFIQQRAKLSEQAFPFLFKTLNQVFDQDLRYEGYRLIAVDGSHIHVPNNPDDPESFVQSRPEEHFHNEFHLNSLMDLLQGTFIDAVIQKYRTQNEDLALIDMVERSELKNAIIVCDRGYESYNNIAHLQNAGWKYVMRIKEKGRYGIADGLDLPVDNEFDLPISLSITRKNSLEVKELLKKKNEYRYIPTNVRFDYLRPTKRKEPAIFYTLEFRVIRILLPEGGYEMLLTNLPLNDFPPEKIRKIYSMRWGIETSFRNLKYSIGLLQFHSKISSFVAQEIYASLIMHNMTRIITSCVTLSDRKRKYEYKISFSIAANIVKRLLASDISPPAVEELFHRNLTPVRPNRKFPRNKPPIKAPIQFTYRIA